ncbi:alpha-1,6-mannosylglycoprotein 6-beta-N-acetylglucosaminyltransferase A-like isoform X2 [Ciona intestinalis]
MANHVLRRLRMRGKRVYVGLYRVRKAILVTLVCWVAVLYYLHSKALKQYITTESEAIRRIVEKEFLVSCGNTSFTLKERYCGKRFKWIIDNWTNNVCFVRYGINEKETPCSIYKYLVFVERVCSYPGYTDELIPSLEEIKSSPPHAEYTTDFLILQNKLTQCGKVCEWIKGRVGTNENDWIFNARDFAKRLARKSSNNEYLTSSRHVFSSLKLRILLHMGLLTKEFGLNFGEAALAGGPLGELVQWSDLMSSLHVMGHDVVLSWSPDRLAEVMLPHGHNEDTCRPARVFDIVFTDIIGLEQIRELHGSLYQYRCILRVLDVYGTDPQFNHPLFNPEKQGTWGGKGLNPAQFFTHFPHSPDNSFLGFVVNNKISNSDDKQESNKKIALLYGKRPSVLNGRNKIKYIDLINEHFNETHATMYVNVMNKKGMEMYESIPSYVINHRNLEQVEFRRLLRQSWVYVGLGFPVEGPAALEAIASGVVYLNPQFRVPRPVADKKPTKRLLASQNPYAENRIGEPHVYTVDMRNLTQVEDVLIKIKNRPRPKPFVTHEFTFLGFLERIHSYLEHQDFCTDTWQESIISGNIWKKKVQQWPPLSVLQVCNFDFI